MIVNKLLIVYIDR